MNSIPIGLFMFTLFFPAFIGWGWDFTWNDTENRTMAQKPVFGETSVNDYILNLNAYITDSVPLRKMWLRINGLVRYGIFRSSLKEISMPGKEGWIYIGSTGLGCYEDTVADYQGTNLFTEEELRDLSDSLSGFRNYLNSLGIEFRLMINLNKSHVYPEYFPDEFVKSNTTRAEQVINYLNKHTNIPIVYPRDALLKEKERYLLYVPTDAHWNTVGGYVGFRELIKSLEPDKTFPDISDIAPVYTKTEWADVSNIINAAWFTDNLWTTTSYRPEIKTEWTSRTDTNSSLYIHNNTGNGKKLLVYHDSYMNQMMDYLGKEYTDCEFIEKEFDITEADILEKNPDIVVFEILERMLNNYREELRYWQKYK